MFSYRHGYHAGNHADVLKHLCQMLLLEKLREKDKAFVYIDTHSGAGRYDLSSAEANKTGEFKQGIDRLRSAGSHNPTLSAYLQLVEPYRQQQQYPGSPEIARQMMRAQDRLQLMEWHNNEVENLRDNFAGVDEVHIHHRNGFEGLVALCPPKPARGLVLMDPSYELASDYTDLVKTLQQAYRRWATGIYAIWYPLLARSRDRSDRMLKQLSQQPFERVLDIQLKLHPQQEEMGMYGSGMLIINPPWQFEQQVQAMLPELMKGLQDWSGASYEVRWLANNDTNC